MPLASGPAGAGDAARGQSLALGTSQCQLTQKSVWEIWPRVFAISDVNTGALEPHLLFLLPFSPPVGSGAGWAHFPYLYLVLES